MCLPNIFAQHCIFEVVLTLAEVEKIFQAHVKNSLVIFSHQMCQFLYEFLVMNIVYFIHIISPKHPTNTGPACWSNFGPHFVP